MAQQVENGHGPGRRHQFERLGAVLGLFLHADLHIGEGGNVFRDGIVELDLAVLDQLHRATTEVIALVSEDRRKMVLSVIGAFDTTSCTPKVS